jgi:hypothetical protein
MFVPYLALSMLSFAGYQLHAPNGIIIDEMVHISFTPSNVG